MKYLLEVWTKGYCALTPLDALLMTAEVLIPFLAFVCLKVCVYDVWRRKGGRG